MIKIVDENKYKKRAYVGQAFKILCVIRGYTLVCFFFFFFLISWKQKKKYLKCDLMFMSIVIACLKPTIVVCLYHIYRLVYITWTGTWPDGFILIYLVGWIHTHIYSWYFGYLLVYILLITRNLILIIILTAIRNLLELVGYILNTLLCLFQARIKCFVGPRSTINLCRLESKHTSTLYRRNVTV